MSKTLTEKLIEDHLIDGEMIPGEEIALKIDQALVQDATGTLVMLELEAMELDKAKTEIAVQYVDHNLIQGNFRNADDHVFLRSAAKKFGLVYSPPGNGVSHPVHMERFGIPGKTLLGSDSHTPAAGSMGMLAIGTGGLDVAASIAGKAYYVKMPKVFGVELKGELPDWCSAKDIILEMLRRYDVKGGTDYIIEYYGDGLKNLSAMERHVIANMGTELGATSTVFPADEKIREFLKKQDRESDYKEYLPDDNCKYDRTDVIDLSNIEPLIAKPSSPGNIVKVADLKDEPVHQVVIGSSANPGLRDFWIVSEIVKGKNIDPNVSFDINPTSRQIISTLAEMNAFGSLIDSGARFHQSGCLGCIGMGQAPSSGKNSLRTMPRNFPGRSGTTDDKVFLCSPETAAASALTGKITDPRELENIFNMKYPKFIEPDKMKYDAQLFIKPSEKGEDIELEKGDNIVSLPKFDELEDEFEVPVALKLDDNISTDEILKGGTDVLPLRSNIPEISKYTFYQIDQNFYDKAMEYKDKYEGFIIVAGENYAQGSSREHAAIAPRYLGQKAVIAKSYARIGWQNLINYGILPLVFENEDDHNKIDQEDILGFENVRQSIKNNEKIIVKNISKDIDILTKYSISNRQKEILLKGGAINYYKENL